MSVFSKAKRSQEQPVDLQKEVNDVRERLALFSESVQALFLFLREYTLDISEIAAERFKNDLQILQNRFATDDKTRTIAKHFEQSKGNIFNHIQRQKSYLEERESEFREIIDLMTAAMTGIDEGNRDFYGTIRAQGERFEAITLLDDIKRIKKDLAGEVEKLRTMVWQKENQDQKVLSALSSQVDGLKKELDKARQSANTDALTGVNNRRALDEQLHRLVERNTVTPAPFALLMMDIDDFKPLNDTYGHTVGDRMLLAFAEKCKGSVRSSDFLARYGGEEFALILPGASLRNATKKAKQLCRTIAAARYAADGSPHSDVVSVTVSIGVSIYRKQDTVKSLIERADQSLYKAKSQGKNRAVAENAW